MPSTVAVVETVRRYPVKSLVGESLDRARVESRGLRGDRLWSVRDLDGKFGSGKSTRRFRRMDGLLDLVAAYDADVPVVRFPDGSAVRGDDDGIDAALSEHVAREVTLAREAEVSHFDDGPVHLVTTASIARLAELHGGPVDPGRFRANLLLHTDAAPSFVEETWIGRRLTLGAEVELRVVSPMPRCVMVTLPQVGVGPDRHLLRTVTRHNDANLGVLAEVVRPGEVAVGDRVRLAD